MRLRCATQSRYLSACKIEVIAQSKGLNAAISVNFNLFLCLRSVSYLIPLRLNRGLPLLLLIELSCTGQIIWHME